jgi:hypothetical protein
MAHKLRGEAATIKKDLFHQKWPPRRDSFMRMLGRPAQRWYHNSSVA